eukprot:6186716-Pleurochrysis_carterae.AAC.2
MWQSSEKLIRETGSGFVCAVPGALRAVRAHHEREREARVFLQARVRLRQQGHTRTRAHAHTRARAHARTLL